MFFFQARTDEIESSFTTSFRFVHKLQDAPSVHAMGRDPDVRECNRGGTIGVRHPRALAFVAEAYTQVFLSSNNACLRPVRGLFATNASPASCVS